MKPLFLLTLLALVFITPTVRAGEIFVGIYPDPVGTSCNIIDDHLGLLTVYVMMSAPDGATGVRLAAPKPACMADAIWLSDGDPWGMIMGNSQTGFSYGFDCRTGFFSVGVWINYFGKGTTEPCCVYPALPDQYAASGRIEAYDCNNQVVYAWGEVSTVNGNASCPCGYTVPVEETTWGRVKCLYME